MTEEPGHIFAQMLEQGRRMAESLAAASGASGASGATGAAQGWPGAEWANAWAEAMPTLPPELMEAFWGRGLNPDGLDAKTRLLLMLAGMTVQGVPAEAPFRSTLRHARAAGASAREIAEAITQMSLVAGIAPVGRALGIARDLLEREGAGAAGSAAAADHDPNREGGA